MSSLVLDRLQRALAVLAFVDAALALRAERRQARWDAAYLRLLDTGRTEVEW